MRLCCMQPDIPGIDSFPGKQLHCHNFRHNEPFRGERVLVVGASFSGECMGYPGYAQYSDLRCRAVLLAHCLKAIHFTAL